MTHLFLRATLLGALLVALSAPPLFAQAQVRLWSTAQTGDIDANGEAVNLPAGGRGLGTVGVQITGTFTGTLALQCSNDNTNWVAINMTPPNSTTPVTSTTSTGLWIGSMAGCQYVRAVSTAWTDGSASVTLFATSSGGGAGGGGTLTFEGEVSAFDGVLLDAADGDPLTDTTNDALRVNVVEGIEFASIDAHVSRITTSTAPLAPGEALASTAIAIGGTYNASGVTLTDTQQAGIQLSESGRVLVELPAGGSGLTDAELRATPVPISGSVTADSELPSAAALADNTANPTVPGVAAFQMCWNGSTWDRCTGAGADTELPSAAAAADNMANPTAPFVLSANMCFDGSTWDRCPPTSGGSGTIDASTSRVTIATDDEVNDAIAAVQTATESIQADTGTIIGHVDGLEASQATIITNTDRAADALEAASAANTPVADLTADETVTSLSASAAVLDFVECTNPNDEMVWVQIFDIASGSVTLGTSAPKVSFGIGADGGKGGGVMLNLNFGTAISYAVTKEAGGSTAVDTDIVCNFGYRAGS